VGKSLPLGSAILFNIVLSMWIIVLRIAGLLLPA
jgi:hypothetical protein